VLLSAAKNAEEEDRQLQLEIFPLSELEISDVVNLFHSIELVQDITTRRTNLRQLYELQRKRNSWNDLRACFAAYGLFWY
jgi:hypothetical protein